MLLNKLFSKLF